MTGRLWRQKLFGIEEALANLAQATAEDRATVTNLTDSKMNLTKQVVYHANHMATEDAAMATIQKTIRKLQGEINTLKINLSG